ncbi:MAG TPA: Holliday junction resolvase RuvX [Rhodanobacteraceae bacterium]|nr:Holliday junction resolvase RuvX [Rhodanobacteraceae bacterium]
MPDAAGDPAASVLGFDFGKRVIGVAVGNRLSGARALATVSNGSEPDWQRLDALIAEWRPAGLVVGLPLRMDGSEQEITHAARRFGTMLGQRHALPVHFADERLSSVEASRRFAAQRASGSARRKDAAALDAIAAEIILETWFAGSNVDA